MYDIPSRIGRRWGWTLLTGLLFSAVTPVSGRSGDDPKQAENSRYTVRQIHDPDGIGKFYMGREIAHVMGFGPRGSGAQWLERPEREREERLSKLVTALKLKPGMVVADIGAGSGVITMLMAPRVGPGGRIKAVDVQKKMLDRLRGRLKKRKISNVDLVLGTEKSPRLKPSSIDLAIFVDVYHELAYPYEMIRELARAMKPGGRIAFVEYRREDPKIRRLIKLLHTMTQAQVKKEIGQPEFRLKWKETIGVLPRQHVIIFERRRR